MIPLAHSLLVGGALFSLGVAIVLARRELLFVLMGLEVMFNGAGLSAVAAGQRWNSADGQVLALVLMAVTAAELAVALVLTWLAYREFGATRAEELTAMGEGEEP